MTDPAELFEAYRARLLTKSAKAWATVCWHGGTMRSLHMVKPFDFGLAQAIAGAVADIKIIEKKLK